MRKSMLVCLLLAATLTANAHSTKRHAKPAKRHHKPAKRKAAVGTVAWRTDFDAALKEARHKHKLVFVDLYTDWCGPCKYLDKTTYHDRAFVRASRKWVMVKVNVEKGARNFQIGQKLDVGGYPGMWMMDGRGKRLSGLVGYWPTMPLIAQMRKAKQKSGVLSARNLGGRRVG